MSDAEIWALYGRRAGDNRQVSTLAEAAGLPWRVVQLAFNGLSGAPNLLIGARTATLKPTARAALSAPWPAVAISAGKRSVPAALWIRRASGGQTKLVHIGRPWAPLAWFDLVVTTAQYGLPERSNVIQNLLPLSLPPDPAGPLAADLADLPRPRLLAVAGGDSRPLAFDASAARGLAADALLRARESGGSLLVVTSPRTAPKAADALIEALNGAGIPVRISRFGEGQNRYADFLAAADAFLVTEDSAAMAAEAALRGRPVALFPLPRRPDLRLRLVAAAQGASERLPAAARAFAALSDAGLISSTRDLQRFGAALEAAGLLNGGDGARAHGSAELRATADRVAALALSR